MKSSHHLKPEASLRRQAREMAILARIAEDLSSSLLLDNILGRVYKSFRTLLPYDRIGLALVINDGRAVRSIGARSSARTLFIRTGYSALLKGSSLATILKTRKPRIISDLKEYLRVHPQSDSTRRIVAEGMRSNLTYPLFAQGRPIGFIFFSSKKRNTYAAEHIDSFRRVATLLSLAVEKGRLYADLKESDAMKNWLMGIAAHDLRNPLTVVIAYLALMEDDARSAGFKDQLVIVQRNCRQMHSIIESVLDASVAQTKGINLNLSRLDLREFLQQIRSDNRILAESKSISLKLDLPSQLPPLMADRARLAQIFENLISNAIKYSPAKSVITLSARADSNAVEIAVADQGPGIPPAEFELLFHKFGRTSVKPTAGERSIGFGLAIALSIVKAHSGSIQAKNRPEGGTVFSVTLPLQARRRGRILLGV